MTDEPAKDVPESVRKEVEAVVVRALAYCNRLGIDWEDFYQAVAAEEKLHPKLDLEELYTLAFRRLEGMRN